MTAMMDQARTGLPKKGEKPKRGYLLNTFRTECEHAASMRRQGTHSSARIAIETARRRVFSSLAKQHKVRWIALHTHRIEDILDRMEETTRAPQDELFEVTR